jgi:hypothetical protein
MSQEQIFSSTALNLGLVRHALKLLFRTEAVEREPLLSLIGQAGKVGQRRAGRSHDRLLVAAERRRNRPR